ncbi:cephalotocin receptor 1-like [Mercenaria mercenaria]|uniref:cephalotocin receptor 1-like n=1 Tax=Mercenaria mercenaria TaxID=6596 RepID=UPI00234EEBC8|nr:cephalotocin receptor 1-like [Mercenaria mercenaria]
MENYTNNVFYENSTVIFVNATVESNGTKSTTGFTRDEDLAKIEIIVQSVIFVLAVVGNGTVLGVLLFKRVSLTRMHLLMLHLSIADLFVAFGSLLPQLAWDVTFVFKGGDILCRLVKYTQTLTIYASSYVLVMTAIDRYLAICHPLVSRKYSSKIVKKMVVIAWTLSLLFSIPQIFIFSYRLTPYGIYDCWATFQPEWTLTFYITAFTILVYIIPTLILIFCYGNICLAVWKSNKVGERISSISKRLRSNRRLDDKNKVRTKYRKSEHLNLSGGIFSTETRQISTQIPGKTDITKLANRRKSSSGITRAKLRTIKLTLTVIFCYNLCWSPFFVAQMWAVYDETAPFNASTNQTVYELQRLRITTSTNHSVYKPNRLRITVSTNQTVYELQRLRTKPSMNHSVYEPQCLRTKPSMNHSVYEPQRLRTKPSMNYSVYE